MTTNNARTQAQRSNKMLSDPQLGRMVNVLFTAEDERRSEIGDGGHDIGGDNGPHSHCDEGL